MDPSSEVRSGLDLLSPPMRQLAVLLGDKGLSAEVGDDGRWFDVAVAPVVLTVTERPPYCDRGRFLVQVESHNILAVDLDDSDGFPRYYFDPAAAATELILWLGARGLAADS